MAMSKKEMAEMDALRGALRQAEENLRVATTQASSGLESPMMIQPPKEGYTNGWVFLWTRDGEAKVEKAWSNSSFHGRGHLIEGERVGSASQRPLVLYATEHDACVAMRLHVEKKCRKFLADVDAMIEATKPGPALLKPVAKKSPGFAP